MARQAGKILKTGFGGPLHVEHKGAIDLVTEMDRQSEAFLLNAVQARFPHHRVIAEESGGLAGTHQHAWIVDPLDGTVNYAHGIPIFSVSVAYAERDKLKLGVVYNPMMDECFSAERGKGAWLNGQCLKVTTVPELEHSLMVTGFYYDSWTNPDNNLDHFSKFMLRTQGVRRFGSAALDLAYVAAGRFDGYWELRLNAWDIAAGGLIVQEAGGLVTNIHGDPKFMQPPFSVLAANPALHAKMLKLLKSAA